MKRLTKQEIAATHRIFNHVSYLCNNYWGTKTLQQARKYASLNRWIMFPTNNIESLREGADFPVPNIYVATTDHAPIVDNNDGRPISINQVGVTCGNTDAMAWVQRALEPKNASFFISALNAMPSQWTVSVEHKIKTLYQDNTPQYDQVEEFRANTVTADQIKNAVRNSESTCLTQGQSFNSESVFWCVTVFNVFIRTDAVNFDENIKDAFRFFGAFNLTRPNV